MYNGNHLGWKKCKLGDITIRVTKGTTPTTIDTNFIEKGINFIKSEAISYDGRIDKSTFFFIDELTHEKLKRSQLEKNDILFSMAGVFLGKNALVTEDILPANTNQALAIIRINQEQAVPLFIHYYLSQSSIVDYVNNMSGQSAQPNINFEEIKSIELTLPPLPEQRAIAGVLSSLDDKIDLLHRQNKTLEGMAEALWRKMFVEEADPGWRKGKLGDFGEFKNGINYSRNENGDNEYSILNVRDIVECKYVNAGNFEKININKKKAIPYLLKKGDIVIVRSASPGESLIVLEEIDNLIYSGFSIRLRCHDKIHSLFLFQFLQSYKKEMDIFSEGTTLKNINQEILNSIELIIPVEDASKEFNERVVSIYNKILLNQGQIRTLSHLRDTLLPKLMSGEVRVR